MAIHEIRVFEKEGGEAEHLRHQAQTMLGIDVDAVETRVHYVEGVTDEEAQKLADRLFTDPNTQSNDISPRTDWDNPHVLERATLPGVMEPDSEFMLKGAHLLGVPATAITTGTEFRFVYPTDETRLNTVTQQLLFNKTVEQIRTAPPETLLVTGETPAIKTVAISELDQEGLIEASKDFELYLDAGEMKNIQDYFKEIGREPTDGELKYLAGAWSEHCCHKTFNAKVFKDGVEKDPLFKRLRDASEPFFGDDVISAYEDNSGVFMFYDGQCIAIKLETHNSPSAIEPYGGSMTGSGGVFRDIMGTGQGAKNILSIDIFCFAPLDLPPEQIPPKCLAPAYLLQRCIDGVRDYGNRMGIPTSNGSMHYHPDFRAKPTVMVGALGIVPEQYARMGHAVRGDYVVAVGGRTGKDGIGGANFSSVKMDAGTADKHAGAVQIGNAIEEKRMQDALIEARDASLIRAITDCGAAGFASAVGEMGEGIGVSIDLERAPLKYEGLAPWEIWVSESQERMVAAVDPEKYVEFAAICAKHGVESTTLGSFGTANGARLDVMYNGEKLVDLDYEFIKRGRTQREMIANWQAPVIQEREPEAHDWNDALKKLMAHPNIRSNEPIVRQYDHEVQGTNVMKPYSGVHRDAPNDAVVLAPILGKPYGLVEAHGMNPVLNNYDPYKGAKWAFAEAMANYVAAGGNPDNAVLSDNFVTATPDEHVMGALDMMVDAYVDCIKATKRPVITGKDSLSSRYQDQGGYIDVPPVLTVTVAGKIPDIAKTVSTDLKSTDSLLILVGKMDYEAMGGSAFHDITNGSSARIPDVDLNVLPKTLRAVHRAIQTDKVLACHDISEGGVVAAATEMAFGGDCGVELIAPAGVEAQNFLFNETAGCFLVEIPESINAATLFGDVPFEIVGVTSTDKAISLYPGDSNTPVFSADTSDLKTAWKQAMQEFFT